MKTFEDLKGHTILEIRDSPDRAAFRLASGDVVLLHHEQSCCESVALVDVTGEWGDVVGVPLLLAEESVSQEGHDDHGECSWTWTFYRLATVRGDLSLRWLGQSNGYYSEDVDVTWLAADAWPTIMETP